MKAAGARNRLKDMRGDSRTRLKETKGKDRTNRVAPKLTAKTVKLVSEVASR